MRESGQGSRKPKKALGKSEKIRLALDRFAPLARGQAMTPLKVLSDQYKRAEAVISKAIISAFSEGLVEVRQVQHSPVEFRRHGGLEERLFRAFPRLHSVVVVEREEDEAGEAERGDYIHRRLGQAMAEVIQGGGLLRPDDTVGLGSGRGVYFTVDALRRSAPLRAKGVTLMSLTGGVFPKAHSGEFSAVLDADLHVALMAVNFESQVTLKVISHPIVLPKNMAVARRNTWLDPDQYGGRTPNLALIGVGVLDGGHRFYKLVEENRRGRPEILEPILGRLRSLVKLSDQVKQGDPYYCPVADVCNRLFFVEPPPGVVVSDVKRRKLQEAIAELNPMLLTITEDQLAEVDHILLIAGTKQKALAILRLLEQENQSVRTLCTDEEAAQEILRIKHALV